MGKIMAKNLSRKHARVLVKILAEFLPDPDKKDVLAQWPEIDWPLAVNALNRLREIALPATPTELQRNRESVRRFRLLHPEYRIRQREYSRKYDEKRRAE